MERMITLPTEPAEGEIVKSQPTIFIHKYQSEG